MTLRFSLNNYYPSISGITSYLYDIYRFMTAVSPSGPGWISIGESNGTTGGMGITGIITSATSLTSTNAWFVLRSPDSGIQILFFRGSATANYAGYYLTYGVFTGGSSSTLPTYDAAKTILFTSSTRIQINANYVNHIVADDAYPYNFYVVALNVDSAPVTKSFISYVNMDGYSLDDGYPYVFMCSDANGPVYSTLDQSINTTFGVKALNASGAGYNIVSPCQLAVNTTRLFPNVGPPGIIDGYSFVTLPILFSSRVLYKGIHYSWFRWPSNATLSDHDTIENKKWIRFGDLMCVWDGFTTPRSV